MAAYRTIDDFCPRATYTLIRNIPSVPGNALITDAWWTVKQIPELPDDTAEFLIHITPITSSSGQISNYADFSAQVEFNTNPEDSSGMFGITQYYYDIQIQLDNAEIYTIEIGKLFTLQAVKQS